MSDISRNATSSRISTRDVKASITDEINFFGARLGK